MVVELVQPLGNRLEELGHTRVGRGVVGLGAVGERARGEHRGQHVAVVLNARRTGDFEPTSGVLRDRELALIRVVGARRDGDRLQDHVDVVMRAMALCAQTSADVGDHAGRPEHDLNRQRLERTEMSCLSVDQLVLAVVCRFSGAAVADELERRDVDRDMAPFDQHDRARWTDSAHLGLGEPEDLRRCNDIPRGSAVRRALCEESLHICIATGCVQPADDRAPLGRELLQQVCDLGWTDTHRACNRPDHRTTTGAARRGRVLRLLLDCPARCWSRFLPLSGHRSGP